ncbi:UNVERIFIED_CONTAM: hypothetical protein RMT77_005992 [Armadillidium vulgare]
MSSHTIAAEEVDVDFLPLIYQYLRCLEKDQNDLNRISVESSQKILEIQKKIDIAREQVQRLPGVEYSKEEQLQRLEALRKQLSLKKKLLLKYKSKAQPEQSH